MMKYNNCDVVSCKYNGFIGEDDKICIRGMIKNDPSYIPQCERKIETELLIYNNENYLDIL